MPYNGNRYDFTSPGGDASDALLEFLAKREAEKRQAMLDALTAKEQHARDEDRRTNREIQKENLEISRTTRQSAADKAKQDRATGIAKQLPQNAELDPDTARVLTDGGLSALLKHEGAVLPSTALSGIADATSAAPKLSQTTATENAGHGERDLFLGTADQQDSAEQRKRLQQIVEDASLPKPVRDAARVEIATGQKIISGSMFDSKPARTEHIGNELLEEQADGTWKVVHTGAESANEGKPYFTYQTTYDAQGRPTGAIRFDARGGPPTFVNVNAVTGGQLKPPPGTTGAQTITNEAAQDQLDRLITMFNGGAKDLIGPLSGRARSAGQQIPGVPVDEKFANFDAASSAFKNSVIKAITGAQMSEPEANRIMNQIPLVTDKPEVWSAKATQTKKNLQDLKNRVKAPRSPEQTQKFDVTAPNGKVYSFDTQEQADAFKKRAGIQ